MQSNEQTVDSKGLNVSAMAPTIEGTYEIAAVECPLIGA